MRREGFELLVGPPTVITKQVDGKTHEPFETVEVQVRAYGWCASYAPRAGWTWGFVVACFPLVDFS